MSGFPRTRLRAFAVILVTLTACRGSTREQVEIRSFEFRPSEISLEAGEKVTWTNRDDIAHTVTSGSAGEQGVPGVSEDVPATRDGRFDLQLDGRGSTYAFSFERPGTYPYFCALHRGMSGTIRVA